jgi:hypothetical protein
MNESLIQGAEDVVGSTVSQVNDVVSPMMPVWQRPSMRKEAMIRQMFVSGDPLSIYGDKDREQMHQMLTTYDNPDQEAKKQALSVFYSQGDHRAMNIVYDDLDNTISKFHGKPLSVDQAYGEIANIYNQQPEKYDAMDDGTVFGLRAKVGAGISGGLGLLYQRYCDAEYVAQKTMNGVLSVFDTGMEESLDQRMKEVTQDVKSIRGFNMEMGGLVAPTTQNMGLIQIYQEKGITAMGEKMMGDLLQASPELGVMMLTGAFAIPYIGATTAIDKYVSLDMEHPEMDEGKKAINATGTGLINAITFKLMTFNKVLGFKEGFRDPLKQGFKNALVDFGKRYAIQEAQMTTVGSSEWILDKMTDLKEGKGLEDFVETTGNSALGGVMPSVPFALMGTHRMYTKGVKEREQTRNVVLAREKELLAIPEEKMTDEMKTELKDVQRILESNDMDKAVKMANATHAKWLSESQAKAIEEIKSIKEEKVKEQENLPPEERLSDDELSAYGVQEYLLRQANSGHNAEDTIKTIKEYNSQFPGLEVVAYTDPAKEIPQKVQADAIADKKDINKIDAFPYQGKVYINARRVSPSSLHKMVLDEWVGHVGLRQVFDKHGWDQFLDYVAKGHKDEVSKWSERYSPEKKDEANPYDMTTESGSRKSAEEFMAHGAVAEIKPNRWKELLYDFGSYLRKVFPAVRFTKWELEGLLSKAYRHMKGKKAKGFGDSAKFSYDAPQAEGDAYITRKNMREDEEVLKGMDKEQADDNNRNGTKFPPVSADIRKISKMSDERLLDAFEATMRNIQTVSSKGGGERPHDSYHRLMLANEYIELKKRGMLNGVMPALEKYTGKANEVDANNAVAEALDTTKFSYDSWMANRDKVREKLKATGRSEKDIDRYIGDIDNAGRIIVENKALQYVASELYSSLKDNASYQYGESVDFSTLCRKRAEFQATLEAISKELWDGHKLAVKGEDLIDIANMMLDMGREVGCGICYVDNSRMKAWNDLENFAKKYPEIGSKFFTMPGWDWIKANEPAIYTELRGRFGTLGGKTFETRTDYRHEILNMKDEKIAWYNKFSGLRWQSWSDFEIVHAIDAMQVTMDCMIKGLAGHAYTKVPDFVDLMAETNLMINQSLVPTRNKADAITKDGQLAVDGKESFPLEKAYENRKKWKNVGTVMVGVSDQQILLALKDPRIDYVIPYHRSGSSKEIRDRMKADWDDYQDYQNDVPIDKHVTDMNTTLLVVGEKMQKGDAEQMSKHVHWNDWQGNLETFFKVCEERNLLPRFPQFAGYRMVKSKEYNKMSTEEKQKVISAGKFKWLKVGEAVEGYEKLLTDRRLYDNEGNFIEQKPLQFKFNMDFVTKLLKNYDKSQGAKEEPFMPVVDKFVQAKLDRTKFSYGDQESRVMKLPLEKIEHGESALFGFDYDTIDKYARQKTPLEPIEVIPPEETGGKWMIYDGSHRYEAVKKRGEKFIDAIDSTREYKESQTKFSYDNMDYEQMKNLARALVPQASRMGGDIMSGEAVQKYFKSKGIDISERNAHTASVMARDLVRERNRATAKKAKDKFISEQYPLLSKFRAEYGEDVKLKPSPAYKGDYDSAFINTKRGKNTLNADEVAKKLGVSEEELLGELKGLKLVDIDDAYAKHKQDKMGRRGKVAKMKKEMEQNSAMFGAYEIVHGDQELTDWVIKNAPKVAEDVYRFVMGEPQPEKPNWEEVRAKLAEEKASRPGATKTEGKDGKERFGEGMSYDKYMRMKIALERMIDGMDARQNALAVALELPEELRKPFQDRIKKINEYTQDPSPAYPEGRRQFEYDKLAEDMMQYADSIAKDQMLARIDKLLDTTNVRRVGKGRAVSLFSVAQNELDAIKEVRYMDPEVVQRLAEYHQSVLDAIINGKEGFDEADTKATRMELARLATYGNLEGKTPEHLRTVLQDLDRLMRFGRDRLSEMLEEDAQRTEKLRNDSVLAISGGKGLMTKSEDIKAREKYNKAYLIKGLLENYLPAMNLENTLRWITADAKEQFYNSMFYKNLFTRIHVAREKEKTLNREMWDAYNAELENIFKVKGTVQVGTKIAENSTKIEKTGVIVFRHNPNLIDPKTGEYQARPGVKNIVYDKISVDDARALLSAYDYGENKTLSEQLKGKRPPALAITEQATGKIITSLFDYQAEWVRHQLADMDQRLKEKMPKSFRFEDDIHDPHLKALEEEQAKAGEKNIVLPRIKEQGLPEEMPLSQFDALYYYLLSRQPSIKYQLHFNGWTGESFRQLEKFMSPEMKQLGEWYVNRLKNNLPMINEVYKKIAHTELKGNDNYFPVAHKGQSADPGNIYAGDMLIMPGFTATRKAHLAEPPPQSAHDMFLSHEMKMHHFISSAEIGNDLRSVFKSKSVQMAIEQYYGDAMHKELLTKIGYFVNGGNASAQRIRAMSSLQGVWAGSKMLYNLSSFSKQWLGSQAFAMDVPQMEFQRRVAEFHLAPWRKAEVIKMLMETPYWKNRFAGSMDRDIGLMMSRSHYTSSEIDLFFSELTKKGMLPTRVGDGISTLAYGWAVYDYHLERLKKMGMPEADAHKQALLEWEMATDRSQQSGDPHMLNSWQLGGTLSAMLTTFCSNPILISNNLIGTAHELARGKPGSLANFGRASYVAFVVNGLMMEAVCQAWKNGDDWDKYSLWKMLVAMPVGSFGSLTMWDMALSAIVKKFAGVYDSNQTMPFISDTVNALSGNTRLFSGKHLKDEDIYKIIEKDLGVLQFLPGVGQPAMHTSAIMREGRRFYDLIFGDHKKKKNK